MAETKCPKCGQTLSILRWNKGKEMTLCDNDRCPAFHNPVSNFSPVSLLETSASKPSFDEPVFPDARPLHKYKVSLNIEITQFARRLAQGYTTPVCSQK